VASAHDRDLIHRDLKPANVMVDDLGAVYVMDWGLAKRVERDAIGQVADSGNTSLGDVMGTPAYMAPEQASGRAAISDARADVFALGVMLYEILTGINPFRGATAQESMEGVLHHDPDPPRRVNRRVPRELSGICMKAIEKDTFKRYRAARDLAEELRAYREHRPVSAAPPRPIDRVVGWARRRPVLASVLSTVAVLAVVAALVVGAQASVEAALVASGYERIDAALERAADLDARIADLDPVLDNTADLEARELLDRRLRSLRAERDVQRELASTMATAILGFTVFSPDERAHAIVRAHWLGTIDELVEEGRYHRAEAMARAALEIHERGGLMEFSEADVRTLEAHLERIEAEIGD
jgi:hypothetical protein